ncbi:Transposase, MuDR, plant [Corchorus capsularis]|uniref:Transposase, MuDR, plant n=1 Tax=Corchorus capsularis TaxID=210143 RepID=A0A1R3JVA4_COCAP|nr:Transposase, MuDR, plant [Corchorus capsularis]
MGEDKNLSYEGGYVDDLEFNPDRVGYFDLLEICEKAGYENVSKIHYKIPGLCLGDGLREVHNDASVLDMIGELYLNNGVIDVYIEHGVDDPVLIVGLIDDGNDGHDGNLGGGNDGNNGEDNGCNQNEGPNGENGENQEIVGQEEEALGAENVDQMFYDVNIDGLEENGAVEENEGIDVTEINIDVNNLGLNSNVVDEDGEDSSAEAFGAEPDYSLHSDYYDTDDNDNGEVESDEEMMVDDATRRKGLYPLYDGDAATPYIEKGMLFHNAEEFKHAVSLLAIKEKRHVKWVKNTKECVRGRCAAPNCPWFIYGAINNRLHTFQLRKFIDTHKCGEIYQNPRMTSKILAELLRNKIMANPFKPLDDIRTDAKADYGVEVYMSMVRRAKKKIMDAVVINYEEQYRVLSSYAKVVRETNPGSTVQLRIVRESPDSKPGLDVAIEALISHAEHRLCARHVEYEENLEKLRATNSKAAEDIENYADPQQWVRAFQRPDSMVDIVDNNLSEAFNKTLLKARKLPIISLFEHMRREMMKRIVRKREEASKWIDGLGPRIWQIIRKGSKIAQHCSVIFNGQDGSEIDHNGNTYVVRLQNKTCSCGRYTLSGIPCAHAICAIWNNRGKVEDYVSYWYSRHTYMQAYSKPIQPMPGHKDWPKPAANEEVLPPKYEKRGPGKPVTARKKGPNETQKLKPQDPNSMSRKGMAMTCSYCLKQGHNIRGCKAKGKNATSISSCHNQAAAKTSHEQPAASTMDHPSSAQQSTSSMNRAAPEVECTNTSGPGPKKQKTALCSSSASITLNINLSANPAAVSSGLNSESNAPPSGNAESSASLVFPSKETVAGAPTSVNAASKAGCGGKRNNSKSNGARNKKKRRISVLDENGRVQSTVGEGSSPASQEKFASERLVTTFSLQRDAQNKFRQRMDQLKIQESRHRLSLQAQSDLQPLVPSIFSRFDAVTKLALKCDRRSVNIGDEALVLISERCRNLTRLKLRTCRNLTDAGMAAFAKNCRGLKKPSCGSCNFGAKGMNAVLDHCPALEELSVKRLRGITEGAAAEPIGPGLAAASLKTICLKELCNGQCFGPLIIGAKNLKYLKLFRCSGDWDKLFPLTMDRVTGTQGGDGQSGAEDASRYGDNYGSDYVPYSRFPCEVDFTHATQDEDHGSRRVGHGAKNRKGRRAMRELTDEFSSTSLTTASSSFRYGGHFESNSNYGTRYVANEFESSVSSNMYPEYPLEQQTYNEHPVQQLNADAVSGECPPIG